MEFPGFYLSALAQGVRLSGDVKSFTRNAATAPFLRETTSLVSPISIYKFNISVKYDPLLFKVLQYIVMNDYKLLLFAEQPIKS